MQYVATFTNIYHQQKTQTLALFSHTWILWVLNPHCAGFQDGFPFHGARPVPHHPDITKGTRGQIGRHQHTDLPTLVIAFQR